MLAAVELFWFRRDLRLNDNAGLYQALKNNGPVLPLFIFDSNILEMLSYKNDARVDYIYQSICDLHSQLGNLGSTLLVRYGKPEAVFRQLLEEYTITAVHTNRDYEPYATTRDAAIFSLLASNGIRLHQYKDQVIFEHSEIAKDNNLPYTIYTPYSRKWKAKLSPFYLKEHPTKKYFNAFYKTAPIALPTLAEIGFLPSGKSFNAVSIASAHIDKYHLKRDIPALNATTHIGLQLRFGTVSIRKLAQLGLTHNETWLNELIWREFFMMIIYHYPRVVTQSFKTQYDNIVWRNNEAEFERWCNGTTGYPLVDAGMRELNQTGFMHNRVRMVTASFLCKHLLIDWRWGEAYFAQKLLDYDLAANNGNWQWAAGTGCDAAPYFRIFNPETQAKRFDKATQYIKKWVPEYGTHSYAKPIVEHKLARERCLAAYKKALQLDSSSPL